MATNKTTFVASIICYASTDGYIASQEVVGGDARKAGDMTTTSKLWQIWPDPRSMGFLVSISLPKAIR